MLEKLKLFLRAGFNLNAGSFLEESVRDAWIEVQRYDDERLRRIFLEKCSFCLNIVQIISSN